MNRILKKSLGLLALLVLASCILIACNNNSNQGTTEGTGGTAGADNGVGTPVQLTILATTDLHNYVMNYDYYTTSESDNYGLVKLATIIKEYQGQNELDDVLLVDNGDLIQGNPLGDYFAVVNPVQTGTTHPMFQALEYLNYDAAALGNHEFNFGLNYLHQIIEETSVPVINANVYNAKTNSNEFKPYVIIDKQLQGSDGDVHDIKIGVIGFVPPQIMNWDKLLLADEVVARDIRACAEEFIPKMREEGADLIVALAHTGYGSGGTYEEGAENVAYHLTQLEGIDVVIGGHSHDVFPTEHFVDETGLENVDVNLGTMNGTFTVQPAKYGEGVGVIKLTLMHSKDGYTVSTGETHVASAEGVAIDVGLRELFTPYHEAVIEYVNGPVGQLDGPLNSFFALVGDDASVQLISDAQFAYGRKILETDESLAQYKDLPLLSAAAPFKAGLSKSGVNAEDYVNIKDGSMAIKDVASLYKYANTVTIVKLTGRQVQEWLEMCAAIYNTIDPTSTEPQPLLNMNFPSFNFDTIDGVTYEFDITKPARYDEGGNLINENSNRVIDLEYNDEPINLDQEFLVVTNNYRGGGGGNFPIFDQGDPVVYTSSDETRTAISDFITSKGTITLYADNNWQIASTDSPVYVTFESSSEAEGFLINYPQITVQGQQEGNITVFIYNLED